MTWRNIAVDRAEPSTHFGVVRKFDLDGTIREINQQSESSRNIRSLFTAI
jgi:hypothetical protein